MYDFQVEDIAALNPWTRDRLSLLTQEERMAIADRIDEHGENDDCPDLRPFGVSYSERMCSGALRNYDRVAIAAHLARERGLYVEWLQARGYDRLEVDRMCALLYGRENVPGREQGSE